MATKYPIGIQTFSEIIENKMVYVDKTDLIYKMVNGTKYNFLIRPRRFGKSLLMSTLQTYFEGKKELFRGLFIEKLEKDWIPYPIIHLDLSSGKYYQPERLDLVVFTNTSVFVIELKYDKSPEEALQQIEQKNYIQPYLVDNRKLFAVGINFSSKEKTIVEWKYKQVR